jgi:hypothetical protein
LQQQQLLLLLQLLGLLGYPSMYVGKCRCAWPAIHADQQQEVLWYAPLLLPCRSTCAWSHPHVW